MALFPNVPDVPGVPPLLRNPNVAIAAISLLVRDALAFFLGSGPTQWGIFKNGFPVVLADSVISFDYKQDWSLSDYPVEQGKFETYNKVNSPFHTRVRFSSGGDESTRSNFIESIAAIAGTTDLFDVVTPEKVYQGVNVAHYDYRRTAASGLGLIVVDVWLLEVRDTATATFTNTNQGLTTATFNDRFAFQNTQQPSGANALNTGVVQPVEPLKITVNKLPQVQ